MGFKRSRYCPLCTREPLRPRNHDYTFIMQHVATHPDVELPSFKCHECDVVMENIKPKAAIEHVLDHHRRIPIERTMPPSATMNDRNPTNPVPITPAHSLDATDASASLPLPEPDVHDDSIMSHDDAMRDDAERALSLEAGHDDASTSYRSSDNVSYDDNLQLDTGSSAYPSEMSSEHEHVKRPLPLFTPLRSFVKS